MINHLIAESTWKGPAEEGKSPVGEIEVHLGGILSTAEHEESRRNPRGPSRKAKYSLVTDSEPVP